MAIETIDKAQEKIINASDKYNLVLAPPVCGKTEILTHRIIKAHEDGVPFLICFV